MKTTKKPVSRARLVRVPIEQDDYLNRKAKANPENIHNYIATEINALIAADFERSKRRDR